MSASSPPLREQGGLIQAFRNFLPAFRPSTRAGWLRYLAAVVAVAAATEVRLTLEPVFGHTAPFILYFPAVFFAAWFGAMGPGLLATALSMLASAYWLLPPIHSLEVSSGEEVVGLFLFGAIGAGFSAVSETLDRSIRLLGAALERDTARQQTLQKWEHAFRQAAWGMAIATTDNHFIEVNAAFAAMHGTSVTDWVGRPMVDMLEGEWKGVLARILREVQQTGHTVYESVHVRKDGSKFPVLAEVTEFKDPSGKVLFRAASFQDITQRKGVELTLELERTRLTRLLEGAPFAVAAYEGPNHLALISNPKHDEMTGGRIVIGRPLTESIPELAGQPVVLSLDEVYRSGVSKSVREFPVQQMRGGMLQEGWYDVTVQAMHDVEGKVSGILSSSIEVTEHVLAQQRVEAARKEMEAAHGLTDTITSNATLGLVMLNAKQHCIFMNPAAEKIFGYTFAEVQALNCPLHDVVHPTRPNGSRYPIEQCPIDRAFPERGRERGEDVFRRKDGTFYPVAFTASPHFENGAPAGTIIEIEDISRRKLAEDLLVASERKFSAVFEHASFAICLVQMPSLIIAAVNAAWVELFEYPKEEAIGKTSVELGMHQDLAGRDHIRRHFERYGSVRNMENRVRTRSGRFLIVSNSLDSIQLDAQSYMLGIFEDVTAKREAEMVLRDNERQFRDLISNLPELAWSAQANGNIDFYNSRWYEYTGTTFEQMEGWGWKSVHDPLLLDSVIERWLLSISTGQSFEMEFPLRGADGAFRWFLTRVRPLRDSSGSVIRWFGINTNIDEQRKVGEERETLVAQLQQTLEVRDEFLAIAAHELRTPLTALQLQIQGAGHLVQKQEGDLAAKVLHKIDAANRHTHRLAQLVENLLDVSRISLGKFPLDSDDLELGSVLRDVLERHQPQARSAGSALRFSAATPVVGRWDRLRLDQLATNLVSNAIKYGRGQPIDIRLQLEGDCAILTVQDRGIGIQPEDLGRIFGRFERAVPTRHFGGLGLGLYITRQIVEAHGGRIEVSSEVGQGSTFKATLPLRGPPASNPAEGRS